MLKPCANISSLPGGEVGRDLFGIELGRGLIGNQHHHHVGPFGGLGHGSYLKAGLLGLGNRLGVGGKADLHLHAGILQVESMGVPLGAVADDGDLLGLNQREVGIVIVISLRHDFSIFLCLSDSKIFPWDRIRDRYNKLGCPALGVPMGQVFVRGV